MIISHTPHYLIDKQVVGLGSTVREIDQLAILFSEVVHLAQLHTVNAPAGSLPYNSPIVKTVLVKPAGGERLSEKISYLWRLPAWLTLMKKELKKADAVHIRCPAVISLLALFACGIWAGNKPCWVKYAGNWLGRSEEPLTYRWQRKILSRHRPNRVVTINGRWPNQPNHVISFYNPSYSSVELDQARSIAEEKYLSEPVKLLFVGRTDEAKGVGVVLQIFRAVLASGVNSELVLVGDSPQREHFERVAQALGLQGSVHFLGWKEHSELKKEYAKAHFILLPSVSEGWPKVLSEAMAYGVVPLASDVSSIPQILAETQAGHAFAADQPQRFVDRILQYTLDTDSWKMTSQHGLQAADLFTYEKYLDSVRKLFLENWDIDLNNA